MSCNYPNCPKPSVPHGHDAPGAIIEPGNPFHGWALPCNEAINHPSHYGGDTAYEAIKVIEAWRLDFNLGNAVKYISRAGKKDPAKLVEDLSKAAWYLQREIEKLSKR